MPKNVPSYKHMFLYRTGLKIEPSQNFIDKFIEIYNDLLAKREYKDNPKQIDENIAKFMINSIFEAIIYCLDFGFDVWINRIMLFVQTTYDKHVYKPDKKLCDTTENIKHVNIRSIFSLNKKMKNKLSENNSEYQKYVEHKQEKYNEIKQYYKEFYGQEDWW